MKKFLLFALIGIALVACNGIPDDEVRAKKGEVMEVHDRTMAQMGTMSKLRKKIGELDTTASAPLGQAHADLQEAHDMMMEWMKDFSGTYDENWPNERKIEFLTEEKEKMQVIENKSNKAIENARQILKEHESSKEPEQEEAGQQ